MFSMVEIELILEKDMTNIKPFYIDSNKYNISALEANRILLQTADPSNREEYYGGTKYCFREGTAYTIEDQPFFGVNKFGKSCTISSSRCDTAFTEISPEDLPTWLSHGQTLSEYNSWKDIGESLKEQLLSSTVDFPQKPTLGLQPRKCWLQNRQYEIVRALHRQVEANEVLSIDWIEELLNSMKGGG